MKNNILGYPQATVNTLLDESYLVVKSVYNNLQAINNVDKAHDDFITANENIASITPVAKKINEIITVYENIPQIHAIGEEAIQSQESALKSKIAAKASEDAAKTFKEAAKASEIATKNSETNAKSSEVNAKNSEQKALASEQAAANSESVSAVKANIATEQASLAKTYLNTVNQSAQNAATSAEEAKVSASAAHADATEIKPLVANALNYKNEAVLAKNEAQKIASGIAALDGSGVTQTVLDLVALLGASSVDTDEYLRTYVDAEGRLLWWIDHDGNIGWSKGIPEPIQKALDALQSLVEANAETSETTDAQLAASIADTDDRLSTAKDADNPEWLKVWQDSDGKVLGGIRTDGSFEFFKGIPQPVADALAEAKADRDEIKATATASTEELQAQITSNDEDIAGLQAKDEDIDNRLATSVVDMDEWLQAVTDKDGRLLYGVKGDGSFENTKGIPTPAAEAIAAVDEKAETNKAGLASAEERLATEIEADNLEWLKVWRDEEGHVLGGIRVDGSFEFYKGSPQAIEDSVKTKSLTAETINWSDNNMSDLEALLLKRGFKASVTDWSDASSIQIPEPRCAVVNIISSHSSMPTSKTSDHKDWMEFWDMQGNYFKKRIINNAQGNSSMNFVKKNFAVDLCNDEWVGDDTFSIRFGDWVPQDSFHCKAYYTDYFRGVAVVSYKLMNEVLLTRGIEKDRPWKKALKVADDWGVVPKNFAEGGDNSLELDNGARCFPDGFPVIVHFNGKFYGIFSWQLKKSRQNMYMNKKTAEHIHLDGTIGSGTLLNYTGSSTFEIKWGSFEIRNPKNLYCMDGSKYEGDTNQQELIDETSENYDASNKDHVRSAKVKGYIKRLSLAMYEINQVRANNYSGNHTAEGAQKVRDTFEQYFDPENLIDYLCVSDIISNIDGFGKNWQWASYDGEHWFINLYDVDMSFGGRYTGDCITSPLTGHLGLGIDRPIYIINEFYSAAGDYGTQALNNRYAELRRNGLFTVDHIVKLLSTWVSRVGVEGYDKEYEKWSDCPCHGESVVNTAYWKLVLDADGNPQIASASFYDKTKTYAIGDTCGYGATTDMGVFTFEAVAETTGQPPVKQFKYYDSIYRVKKWITKCLSNMDVIYKYSEE